MTSFVASGAKLYIGSNCSLCWMCLNLGKMYTPLGLTSWIKYQI